MKDRATSAGLELLRMYNESSLAVVSFGLDKHKTEERNIIICDLGSNTYDVTFINVDQYV